MGIRFPRRVLGRFRECAGIGIRCRGRWVVSGAPGACLFRLDSPGRFPIGLAKAARVM